MKNCLLSFCIFTLLTAHVYASADDDFAELARQFIDEFPALHPVSATQLGDHRFDGKLDEVSEKARREETEFCRRYLKRLEKFKRRELSRDHQVDAALLEHQLRSTIWQLESLQEWAWNPLSYTGLAGDAVYGLMARDFADQAERLRHVADRLEAFPRMLAQVRETLDPARVPKIHAETAVKQNRGVLSIIDQEVEPLAGKLPTTDRQRLEKAMAAARREVEEHQEWLEQELLPNAAGDARLGRKLFDEKLAFTLQSPLKRDDIRRRAEKELVRVREQMWTFAREVYQKRNPYTKLPDDPSDEYKQAIIRAALEVAYANRPSPDQLLMVAREALAVCTAFVQEKDLVTVPDDPVEIIIMPEFRRGVSLAYCDAPGPLDVGQKTFYAVAPLPEDWSEAQVTSFLREYNLRSIYDLTVHEAMPGHFLQLAVANRCPSTLRAVLSSGVFIEGWAVYTEQMMAEAGLLAAPPPPIEAGLGTYTEGMLAKEGLEDHGLLMRLIALKWYLRSVANALIDQAIHVDGMKRDEAMRLMIEDTFQEEREAAAKWIRAQLTSTQLSTYFVGYQEHRDLRREAEEKWGDEFSLKRYHDGVISFGSPPVQFVRALLLGGEIRWRNIFVREIGADEAAQTLRAEDAKTKQKLAKALSLHASFDNGLNADFARGDKTCYVAQGKELVVAAPTAEVRLASEGRFGGGLHFTKKNNFRPTFKDAGVLGYNDRSWRATVSVWLRLNPDEDLEPGYCDPVQIVGDDGKKGFIFLEWSKDETPRYFRYAIRPLFHIWNPDNVQWADIPFEKRPMVQVARAPFSRDAWTHVVFTLANVNDQSKSPFGRLYLNGALQGSIENWNLTFGWDRDRVLLVLGAAYVGYLDDLAVFNRDLTDGEVRLLYGLEGGAGELSRLNE